MILFPDRGMKRQGKIICCISSLTQITIKCHYEKFVAADCDPGSGDTVFPDLKLTTRKNLRTVLGYLERQNIK
jgi:hypothetical protein